MKLDLYFKRENCNFFMLFSRGEILKLRDIFA